METPDDRPFDDSILPPIPLEIVVEGLRGLNSGLNKISDKLWETQESELADRLQAGLSSTNSMIHQLLEDIPSDADIKEELTRRSLLENGRGDICESSELSSVGTEHQMIEHNIAQVNFVRDILHDLRDELLNVSREEIEEISDVVLASSRIWVEIFHSIVEKTLRLLEKDYTEESDENRSGHIEDATEEEIAELYRQRGEEPPVSSKSSRDDEGKERVSLSSRRNRPQPQRVLWEPLTPKLILFGKNLPHVFETSPWWATSTVALFLPFSGLILFCLPGVLVTDTVLQTLYDAYGPSVELWVDSGKKMVRLNYVMARLAIRQSYRFLKRQMKKAQADPQQAINEIGNTMYYAISHPVETGRTVYEVGKKGVSGFWGFMSSLSGLVS